MIYSYITYVGDGDTRLFGIPFSYLKKEHVKVYINNVPYTDFIWSTDSTLEFASAPTNGAIVRIQRETPYSAGMVKFTTSNILDPDNLNLTTNQLLYALQEAMDRLTTTIAIDNDNKYDAQNKVIKNVADPIDPTDAVNKRYIQTAVDQANASAAAAKTSETNAKNSEINAALSASTAKTYSDHADEMAMSAEASALNARGSEQRALTSELNAKNSELNAKDSELNAKDSEINAKDSELNAVAAANEANTHKQSAQASASAASIHAINAANSATAAATSATQAATSANSAVASAEQAEKWANEAIGVEVEAGKYSAKHWANEARRIANGELIYPVGSIYINASVSTNPATLLGFGVWERFGKGRVLVGVDESQADFNAAGKTGGAKDVKLTVAQMPKHSHMFSTFSRHDDNTAQSPGGWESRSLEAWETYTAGGDQPHPNMPPYITVYMWKRIA